MSAKIQLQKTKSTAQIEVFNLMLALLRPAWQNYAERAAYNFSYLKFFKNSISVLMPKPVAPSGTDGKVSFSAQAGPAMSRCAHGVSPINSLRNSAAVIEPAPRPSPMFFMSATLLLIKG